MLPFLKKNKEASISVSVQPDHIMRESDHEEEHDDDSFLHAVADELIAAIHSKRTDDVVEALRAAFHILDAEPHLEGPHEDIEGEE